MRYAVRPKQILDSVFCQRSAVVIGRRCISIYAGNVFHTMYDVRGDSNAVIEPRCLINYHISDVLFKEPPKIYYQQTR